MFYVCSCKSFNKRHTRDLHINIGVPRGVQEAPRSPKWTPDGPPRKLHGTFRDIQEANKNTRKTRDGQDLTKDWRNM